jgi:hypothetical protein
MPIARHLKRLLLYCAACAALAAQSPSVTLERFAPRRWRLSLATSASPVAALEWRILYPEALAAGLRFTPDAAIQILGVRVACVNETPTLTCIAANPDGGLLTGGAVGYLDLAATAALPPFLVDAEAASADGSWLLALSWTVPPQPLLESLTCTPARLRAGETANCKLTLSEPFAYDQTVALSSGSDEVATPDSVAFPAGVSEARFTAAAVGPPAPDRRALTPARGAAPFAATIRAALGESTADAVIVLITSQRMPYARTPRP